MKNIKIEEDTHQPYEILRAKDVARYLGCSLTTLWRLRQEKDFPNKVQVSDSVVGWKAGDIKEYIDSKMEPAPA